MIYVDTYNGIMFHRKENCLQNLRSSFVEDFAFSRVFYSHDDGIKEILEQILNKENEGIRAFEQMKELANQECKKFVSANFSEKDDDEEDTLLDCDYMWANEEEE